MGSIGAQPGLTTSVAAGNTGNMGVGRGSTPQAKPARTAQPTPEAPAIAHAQLVANRAPGVVPASRGRTLFHLRPPGDAVLLLFAADGACVRPCALLRLRSFPGPCSVLLRLCFRREGDGQDGAAGAGLPAHQGEPGFAAVAGCSAPRARPQGARDLRPRGCDPPPTPTPCAPETSALRPRPRGLGIPSRDPRPVRPRPRGLGTLAPPLTVFSPQLGRYSALFLGMAYGAKRYSE